MYRPIGVVLEYGHYRNCPNTGRFDEQLFLAHSDILRHLVVKIAVNLCVTFNYGIYCRVCYFLQCCETLGWVTGRASGL